MNNFYLTDMGFPVVSPYACGLTKIKRRMVTTPPGVKKERRFYHVAITRLFLEMIKHPKIVDDMEFSCNVLHILNGEAGKIFFVNPKNNFGGYTPYEFLKDTHRFIQGEERVISVLDWLGLLLASRNEIKGMKITVNPRLYNVRGTYVFDADEHRKWLSYIPQVSDNLVINWATRKNGIQDILTCLFAVYGRFDLYGQDNTEHKHVFST